MYAPKSNCNQVNDNQKHLPPPPPPPPSTQQSARRLSLADLNIQLNEENLNLKQRNTTQSDLINNSRTQTSTTNEKSIKNVLLKKGPNGFGIAISEDKTKRLIIHALNPQGVAFKVS